MPNGKVVANKTAMLAKPELRVEGAFGSGMKIGFLLRGELDRARAEIEDHL